MAFMFPKEEAGEQEEEKDNAFEGKNSFPITPINCRVIVGKMNGIRNLLKAAVYGTR